MSQVLFKGSQIHLDGHLPKVGDKAPDFTLVTADLKDVSLKDFEGQKKILSIVPSLDTGLCLLSTKKFHEAAEKDHNLIVLVISADLPFAQKRACDHGGLDKVKTLSMMRSKDFAKDYGVLMKDGPLKGICARAVIVLDEHNKVEYIELVPEITQEPNYEKAIQAFHR